MSTSKIMIGGNESVIKNKFNKIYSLCLEVVLLSFYY